MMKSFRLLAKLKFLRGTALDILGYSAERKQERADIAEYESLLNTVLDGLTDDNYPVAVELAGLAEKLRGYGHVKDRNREKLAVQKETLLSRFRGKENLAAVKIVHAA
jgi:indolepyruvate ferredoxin oxidoreductase